MTAAFAWGLVDGRVVRGARINSAERARTLARGVAHSLWLGGDTGAAGEEEEEADATSCNVISSAAGLDHALRVCQPREAAAIVEARGGNAHGQADPAASTPARVAAWTPVAGLPPAADFVEVAAGERHSLACTKDGRVFAWGERFGCDDDKHDSRSGSGKSGHQQQQQHDGRPAPPHEVDLGGAPAVGIAAGGRHCLALTQPGAVCAWGSNLQGQCGLSPDVAGFLVSLPACISSLGGIAIASVAAGGAHCVAVSRDGAAYAWGRGLDGELGSGLADDERGGGGGGGDGSSSSSSSGAAVWRAAGLGASRSAPALVEGGGLPGEEHVVQAACGARHTLLRCASGAVYAFGFNAYGQCCCCAGSAAAPPAAATLEQAGVSRAWTCAHGHAIYSPVRVCVPLAEVMGPERGASLEGGSSAKRARRDDGAGPRGAALKATAVLASGWRSIVIVE